MQDQPSRRAYGTGSLTERSGADGTTTWYGVFRAGGRQRKVRLGLKRVGRGEAGLSRKEAEAELRKVMAAARPGDDRLVPASVPLTLATIAGLVADKQRLDGRSPRTIASLERSVRLHLVPFFRERGLGEFTRGDVNAFLAQMVADGASPKFAKNVRGDLAQILNYAIAEGWLASNVCGNASMPKAARLSDLRFLELDELEQLVASGPDADPLGVEVEGDLYLVAAMTGLRQGELLGLWWEEVDFERQVIRVTRQWLSPGYGPVKDRENRSVPMAPRVAEVLARRALSAKGEPRGSALVFPHPETGEPISRHTISERFRESVTRAGVRTVTFHHLRHTFGTTIARGGASPVQIMDWMGHSEFKTTQKYLHYSPRADEAQQVGAAFGGRPLEPDTADDLAE